MSSTPRRVFVALGSNLGDRTAHLRRAVDQLPDVADVSTVYETAPVGGPDGQGPYLNAVVALLTTLSGSALLDEARRIEALAGRVRTVANGPRTLDVDILFIEGEQIDTAELTVPHPRMWQRRFVVAPLADVAPDLVPADWRSSVPGEVWPFGRLA